MGNKDGAKDKAEKDKPKETDKPGAKDKAKEPKAKATLLGLQSMTGSAGGGDCTPTFTCGSSGTDECPCPDAGRMPGMMDDIMGSADAGDFEGVMAGCVDDEAAFAEECKKYDDCPEDATCAKAAAAGECFKHDGHLAAICCMSCAGTMMDSAAEMYDDPAAMAPGNDKAKDEAKDKAKDKEKKDGAKDKAEKDKPKETDKPGAKDKAKEPKAKATLLGLQSMTGSAGGGDCTPTFTCGSSGTDECPCPDAGRMPGMMDDIMGSAD